MGPSFLLLKYSLRGFPGLFTVISEHIFRAHVKIASRLVSYCMGGMAMARRVNLQILAVSGDIRSTVSPTLLETLGPTLSTVSKHTD